MECPNCEPKLARAANIPRCLVVNFIFKCNTCFNSVTICK